MFAGVFDEVWGRGVGVVFGVVFGSAITWAIARWRRLQERRSILRGDARDTVVIQQHLVASAESPRAGTSGPTRVAATLRIRTIGQGQLAPWSPMVTWPRCCGIAPSRRPRATR